MTQDELWLKKYQEIITFIETNKRNHSKHNPEERYKYCNWIKHNKKLINAGTLKPNRIRLFKELLAMIEENKHKNQWV